MSCDHTVDDAMFLLKRNWFIDPQDVYSLFWELSEDVYYDVYQRRRELPTEIQNLFMEDIPTSKVKLVNITENEWNDEMLRKDGLRLSAIRNFKKTYVSPPRLRESIDSEFDKLENQIENKRIILEDMLRATKKSKKYVPPGQRYVEDEEPMIRDTRMSLQRLENEFDKLKERIITLDKLWSEQKCLDAMLENAGKLYET